MKHSKISKKLCLVKTISYIVFLALGVFIIYWIITRKIFPVKIEGYNNSNEKLQIYTSQNKYADVTFKANNNVMYVTIKYKDLAGVSAIHIHANENGSPGPILGWLGTTQQWQDGVKQNTPGTNSPCCTKNNPKCILTAPNGTPFLSVEMEKMEKTFTFYKKCGTQKCKSECMWIKNGSFLVVHGFNFQQVVDGNLTNGKPGLDIIEHTPFTQK
jgi:hypothetical protein